MKDFNIINFNDLTWQLNIAIIGAVFSVFCLIYNDNYIYYGLITFIFGVVNHIFYKLMEWIFLENGTKDKKYWLTHIVNILFSVVWIFILINLY